MRHEGYWRPPLPREHGAWAMFVAPLLVGIGAAGKITLDLVLLSVTVFGFFLLRYPLMLVIKSRPGSARTVAWRWAAFYAAVTALAGTMLMAQTRLWLLVPMGLLGFISLSIYLWHAARRAEMSALSEWVGIAGLALGAPGAFVVATHQLNSTAWGLYLLNVLYFGGTVFYVKFRVREQPRLLKAGADWRSRLWAGRVALLYHLLAIAAVLVFAALHLVPALVLAAFALPMCKVIGGIFSPATRVNIRRLGFIEVGLTTLFAIVVLIAYW